MSEFNSELKAALDKKIIYFTEAFKNDPLFNYIGKNEYLYAKFFDYNNQFFYDIDIEPNRTYGTGEVWKLVGATSNQRVLNILNDKERNFYDYISPAKLGGKLNVYDVISTFKLKMIFFMLSENFKVNEVAHILGLLDPVSVIGGTNTVNKHPADPNLQTAELKSLLFEHLKPVYEILYNVSHNQNQYVEAFKQYTNEQKIELEINDAKRQQEYLEKELHRLRGEALTLRFNIKIFEKKIPIQEQQKAGFWKSLFGKKDDASPLSEENLKIYQQFLEEINYNTELTEKVRVDLATLKERIKNKTELLEREKLENQDIDLSQFKSDTKLLEKIEGLMRKPYEEQFVAFESSKIEQPQIINATLVDYEDPKN